MRNYPKLAEYFRDNPALAEIYAEELRKLKTEEKNASIKDYLNVPNVLIAVLLLFISITAYLKLPKIIVKFKLAYSNVQISEGRKRLRIFLSLLTAILFYFYLFATAYSLDSYETFIQLPLLSLVTYAFTFVVLTASYWVLDGYKS